MVGKQYHCINDKLITTKILWVSTEQIQDCAKVAFERRFVSLMRLIQPSRARESDASSRRTHMKELLDKKAD